ETPLRPLLEARLAEEDRRVLVVRGRELEVDGAPGAPPQELDLDLADPPADLEHGRALDPALLEELDHPPGGLVETALPIPRRHAPREARPEEPIAAARVAAATHRSACRAEVREPEAEHEAGERATELRDAQQRGDRSRKGPCLRDEERAQLEPVEAG